MRLIHLSHPESAHDPSIPVPDWGLSPRGVARATALARRWPFGKVALWSSPETKAMDCARLFGAATGLRVFPLPDSHEVDRSATGFLPPAEFEAVADQFFAHPAQSARGWETADHAQARILREVDACLSEPGQGDVLFVGHGGVGTLLFCALGGLPISRIHDQGPGGGGCWFGFDLADRKPHHGWQAMELLSAQ